MLSEFPRDKKGHIQKPMGSPDAIGLMTHSDMAKEVGMSEEEQVAKRRLER
jgi:hypothetical protein